MEGLSAVFVLLLMGQMARCIDLRTSADILNITSESTNLDVICSPTESNIHTILFIKLYAKSSFGDSSEKLISKIIAVTTSTGTSTGKDTPTALQEAVISGHLNERNTLDSRLQISFNFTRLPCGFYSIVFSCELSYLESNTLYTLTTEANETLTINHACNTATTHAIDVGLLSGAGYVQHWLLFLVGYTALNLLL